MKEYWIVNPVEKQIEQYILRENSFEKKRIFDQADQLTSGVMSGFELSLEEIFVS